MNMLAASMIQVSPQIKLKPFQHAGRTYIPAQIHFTGMRILIEALEQNSTTAIWKDFPASHGLYAPCIFDLPTDTIHHVPGMDWWAKPMRRLRDEPPLDNTRIDIDRRREAKSWIILNTLDNIFGHSLLLLLNAQYYLDHFSQHGIIVVATPALQPYIPRDVHETWIVHTAPRETELYQKSVNNLFHQRCAEAEVYIATAPAHPDPSRYDVRRFNIAPATGPINTEAPKIIFTYRGTRLWGGSWRSERARLIGLAQWLKKLWPNCDLSIHGHATLPSTVPHWNDNTRSASTENYDALLLQALASADLVLGAHGSSQLLPTAISRLVLQLVPLDKQPSLLQDALFDLHAHDLRQHIWRRRFLYGNHDLSDVSPRHVAQLINAMISMQAHFDFYQSAAASDPLRDPAEIEKQFAENIVPQLAAWKDRLNETLDRRLITRLKNFLHRFIAERD